MRNTILLFAIIASSFDFANSEVVAQTVQELPTVEYVDLNRYQGKWYAISAVPIFFTKFCKYQTAEYALLDESTVSVKNTCYYGALRRVIDGGLKYSVEGTATPDNQFNSDLTVRLKILGFRTGDGDYKVLALDEDYQHVLVGSEDRKSLWILARDKEIPAEVKTSYLQLATDLGFDTSKLVDSVFF